MNPFINSETNKRYYTYDHYLKDKYHQKVFKVALDGGFTCPNRDGKCGVNGCIYCSKLGSGEYAGNRIDDLLTQFEKGKKIMLKKWPDGLAMPYFQSFTSTYAPLDYLKKCYEPFIEMKDVIGLVIATRPDCLDEEVLDYLESINKRKDLYIELGLQTSFDSTADIINRCYKYKVFENAVKELSLRNIKVTVHLINGLPNENKEMMIETVKKLATLPIFGIKFHSLSVLKDTKLEEMYIENNIELLSKDEYLDIVSDQLTYLPNNIVIQRIATDAKASDLIAPKWNAKKVSVINDLDKLMVKKNIYQGCNYKKIAASVDFSHRLALFPKKKELAVDATIGNGHDSHFLLHHYKKAIGFDIQDIAIKRSLKLLGNYDTISIIKDSFINLDKYIKEPIDCLLYNLGFLPGSNHSIKTNYQDDIISLSKGLKMLSNDGICIVVFYTQHDNSEEYNNVMKYIDTLKEFRYSTTQINHEIILEVTKNRG